MEYIYKMDVSPRFRVDLKCERSLAPVSQQERLFGECLAVVPRDKPTILHIRPASEDPEVITQAYHRARMIMKEVIGSRQFIQMHSISLT